MVRVQNSNILTLTRINDIVTQIYSKMYKEHRASSDIILKYRLHMIVNSNIAFSSRKLQKEKKIRSDNNSVLYATLVVKKLICSAFTAEENQVNTCYLII